MGGEAELYLNRKGDEVHSQSSKLRALRDACVERVDWDALCSYASFLNGGSRCTLLPNNTMGGLHLIRILSFDGDTRWIARIQLQPSTTTTPERLRPEIHTMELVRENNLPIPTIFGYKLDDGNAVRAAFILMESLPGSSAVDAEGAYDAHHGQIPSA
jgi:hypothetical protein